MSLWNPTGENESVEVGTEPAAQPATEPIVAAPAPTAAPTATPTPAPAPTATPTPAPAPTPTPYAQPAKKDNKRLIITIAVIVGALLLCCIVVSALGGCAALLGVLNSAEGELSDIVKIDITDPTGGGTDEIFDYQGTGEVKVMRFGETVWLDSVSFTAEETVDEAGEQVIDILIENTSTKDFYLPIESAGESNWTAQDAQENWLSFSYTEWDLGFTESTGGLVKPGEAYSLTLRFKDAGTGARTTAIFVTASLLEPLEGVGSLVWLTPEFYDLYLSQTQ